jgi:hypothetical protein
MKYAVLQDNFCVHETFCYFVGSITIFMKIRGSEREYKGSLEHHMNSKFMINVYQDNEL